MIKYLLSLSVQIGAFATPWKSPSYLIRQGLLYGIDNGCFGGMPNPVKYFKWLKTYEPYRDRCLFAVCFDCVGDAKKTLELFDRWYGWFQPWPVAFVAQDGQEGLDFPNPETWNALFIGGSTKWKMGIGSIECIKRAQELGKHIHIGRVNYWKRYEHFRSLEGSNDFTCDGSRQIYQGLERTLNDWEKHMERDYTPYLPIFGGDSGGEPTDS